MSAPSPLRLASVAILCAIPWLLTPAPAGAATLHVVIATDIGANDIGGDMRFDASELAQLVAANVPRDQVQIVLVGQRPGEGVDRNAILRAIYGLKVQPEDTVFFYYITWKGMRPLRSAGTYSSSVQPSMKQIGQRSRPSLRISVNYPGTPSSRWSGSKKVR
jgi:hypothetical protein